MSDNWFQDKMKDPEFKAAFEREERIQLVLDGLAALIDDQVATIDEMRRRVAWLFCEAKK
ncbi:hypothetical protein M0R36_10875 [bacterium]|jgi:hypothetical protein|nr:hypothetical protein [bacterium]